MASEKQTADYAAIIADLERKKAAIEVTIASLKAFQAMGSLGAAPNGVPIVAATADVPGVLGASEELPKGALHNKSFPAAIKLYLSAVKKKQTIKEITGALQKHGMESTAASFESVVTGSLNRLKNAGEVLRFTDGWGLSEWYPESYRTRVSSEPKQPRRGGKRKRSKRASGEPSMEDRLKTLLDVTAGHTPKELASKLGSGSLTGAIGLALERMEKKGLVSKDNHGKYHAAKAAPVVGA